MGKTEYNTMHARQRWAEEEAGYEGDILYESDLSCILGWMNKTDPAQSDLNGHNEGPGMRGSAGLNRCQIGIRCTRPFLRLGQTRAVLGCTPGSLGCNEY